jgi:hypothetical protein
MRVTRADAIAALVTEAGMATGSRRRGARWEPTQGARWHLGRVCGPFTVAKGPQTRLNCATAGTAAAPAPLRAGQPTAGPTQTCWALTNSWMPWGPSSRP